MRIAIKVCLAVCLFSLPVRAQRAVYLGASGGVANLSGDGRAAIGPSSVATSLYDPRNGGAANLFAGVHLFNYVSVEANYTWNRNDVTLISSLSSRGATSFYQQPRSSTEDILTADVLVYFRKRSSRIRPYLSEGAGAVHSSSRTDGKALSSGGLPVPPPTVASTTGGLRTSTGLDVRLRGKWYFRFTFGETISHNADAAQLSPPGRRLLKNFQTLFGIYRTF